jgi:predicted phosphodiesterase
VGARFQIGHANFVAYLTADHRDLAPRADAQALFEFLASLTGPGALISSTMGTPDDWTHHIGSAAEREMMAMDHQWGSSRVLSSAEVARRLDPLRTYFTGYELYAMVLPSGSWQQDTDSFRFFTEAAVSSHSKGLVLMPDYAHSSQLTEIVDPFPALQTLAENPVAPPAVVFWTRLKTSCVLPLREAQQFFRQDLLVALDSGLGQVDRALRFVAGRQRSKRILHLSDLHFGAKGSGRRRSWLKEHLTNELKTADRVVVTGDLFDNPKEPLRESFDEFRLDVENITRKDLLVIPGNHDVRSNGNAIGRFGRNSEYVTDLRWEPVVFDDDLQTAFFSFNSSETGNLARGAVGERQRLDRGVLYDREVRRRPEVAEFMKIALVHHHPYAYGSAPTALYERILAGLFGGEEQFIAFDEADAFMAWCAARGVSLVLHGHKHVPHLTTTTVEARGLRQHITVVGCGSTTGVDKKPMCYDIVTLDPETKRWNVLFYHDEKGDGSGFGLQNVSIDLRSQPAGRH